MAEHAVEEDARYWAFISYSHKDAAFGRRLHKRLESYVLPRRLVGRKTPRGLVPRRLAPIFRDREELPAACDLTSEVRAALSEARSLVVVCSTDAAASPWVAREIELFRQVHPDRPLLAAILSGEPRQCFPPSLISKGPLKLSVEPLAADFRPYHDGTSLGLLKLVAGIVGLRLDELIQRDAQRRTRRVMAVTSAALVIMLMMGVLTAFALSARTEAMRQRSEAEGFVEFMMTDLRSKLKGVGRLDIMGAVNERALHYYAGQDLSSLAAESLERRARILHAMGEDDETRGDHDLALSKFREARRTTAALLTQSPDDPERLFNHAQSEYWLGYVDYNRGRLTAAKPAFKRYQELAARMHSLQPDNTKYRLEEAYAEGNLCAVARRKPVDALAALHHCTMALASVEAALRHPDKQYRNPDAKKKLVYDLMESLADMADAYRLNGELQKAVVARSREQALLQRELDTDPSNMDLKDTWIALQRSLSHLDMLQGNKSAAESKLARALVVADTMAARDPKNVSWAKLREALKQEIASFGVERSGMAGGINDKDSGRDTKP